jgi:hypothetical protein
VNRFAGSLMQDRLHVPLRRAENNLADITELSIEPP